MKRRMLGVVLAVFVAGGIAPVKAAEAVPAVAITVAPAESEALFGGPCYVGDVVVEQSPGFLVSRLGPADEALFVTLTSEGGPDHVDYVVGPETIEVLLPAGETSVPVPRSRRVQEPGLSEASWSMTLEPASDGSYTVVGEGTAAFSGYEAAGLDSAAPECRLQDGAEDVVLLRGERLMGPAWFSRSREFHLVGGELPPGILLDRYLGLSGAPLEVGEWQAYVEVCPYPPVGKRICGTTTYSFTVVMPPAACPPERIAPFPFWDVRDADVHRRNIACVAWWGITKGGANGTFEGDRPVTRGQLASFLSRALAHARALPTGVADAFHDDDGTTHEASINTMVAVGVLRGDAHGGSSEGSSVTRAQAASMLVRAIEWVTGSAMPPTGDHFGDDAGSPHEANIDRLAAAQILSGTGPATFGPDRPLSRSQMATLLAGVLSHLVDASLVDLPA